MTRSVPWPRILIEGVVIVGSILLAFGIEAAWEERQQREEERAILAELHSTLGEDLAALIEDFETMSAVHSSLPAIAERFESGDLRSTDRDNPQRIRGLGRFTGVRFRFGPFETLKARGLDLISNQSLRIGLTSLYEDQLPRLVSTADLDRQLVRDRILPFLLDYLELDERGNWVLRQDEAEARSLGTTLARYRARNLSRFYLPSFELAIESMNQTLAEIEGELEG